MQPLKIQTSDKKTTISINPAEPDAKNGDYFCKVSITKAVENKSIYGIDAAHAFAISKKFVRHLIEVHNWDIDAKDNALLRHTK